MDDRGPRPRRGRRSAGGGRGAAHARNRGWPRLRSEEHTSELQSRSDLVCRLLLEKKKGSYRRYLPLRLRYSGRALSPLPFAASRRDPPRCFRSSLDSFGTAPEPAPSTIRLSAFFL